MFITSAYAQSSSALSDPFSGLLIPMLLMVVIFYFLVIRPQSQRQKQHREMVEMSAQRVPPNLIRNETGQNVRILLIPGVGRG